MSIPNYEDAALANLKAQVEAVNLAGEVATRMCAAIEAAFKPLVGTIIQKADGTLTKKAQSILDATADPIVAWNTKARYFCSSNRYTACVIVKTCVQSEHTAMYAELTVCIGDVQDGVLKNLSVPQFFRSDWTADEVQRKRHRLSEIENMLDEAKSALFPFSKF